MQKDYVKGKIESEAKIQKRAKEQIRKMKKEGQDQKYGLKEEPKEEKENAPKKILRKKKKAKINKQDAKQVENFAKKVASKKPKEKAWKAVKNMSFQSKEISKYVIEEKTKTDEKEESQGDQTAKTYVSSMKYLPAYQSGSIKKSASKYQAKEQINGTAPLGRGEDILKWQEKNQQKKKMAHKGMEKVNDIYQNVMRTVERKIREASFTTKFAIFYIAFFFFFYVFIADMGGVWLEVCTTVVDNVLSGYSKASDFDMSDAENYFSLMEANLQDQIDQTEELYPGFDGYVYELDDIGHDATYLMAYLSSCYEDYSLEKVKGTLEALFSEMYKLEYTESEGKPKILTVTLTKKSWEELMSTRITPDQQEDYDTYLDTGGAHQAFANPVGQNWSGHISSPFGWRIHPITGKERFHKGVDIALPLGTKVGASSPGRVVRSYYSQSAGNYIVIEDGAGYQCHYMHLNERFVKEGDVVTAGMLIGTIGSTGNSTGPHLHLGITDANGEWLNPTFLVQGGS